MTVFNLVVTLFGVAMKSALNATPIKPGVVRGKEVGGFEEGALEKVYKSYEGIDIEFPEEEEEGEGEPMDI